jgi:hypothetical protein
MTGGNNSSKAKQKALKSEIIKSQINKLRVSPIKRRKDEKRKKKQMEIMAEAAKRKKKSTSHVTQQDVRLAMVDYKQKEMLLKISQDEEILFEDSYGLLVLIIYSIIKNCQSETFELAFTTSLEQRFGYIFEESTQEITPEIIGEIITEKIITEIISSEFIEPIYYILYRRFYYNGVGYFDFGYISKIVYLYITDKAGFLTITTLSIKVRPASENVTHIVRKIVGRAFDEINTLTNANAYINNIFRILKNMALDVVQYFPEISLTEENFVDPNSVTASFSPQYVLNTDYIDVPEEDLPEDNWFGFGGRAKTLNKKNIRNKRTRKGKHHRKTYKK